jgi:hypothetical protein
MVARTVAVPSGSSFCVICARRSAARLANSASPIGVEARAQQGADRGGQRHVALDRGLDALVAEEQAVAVHQPLVRQRAQGDDELGLVDRQLAVARGEVDDREVDPLHAHQVVLDLLPRGAGGVDGLAVVRLDHEAQDADRAVRRVGHLVQVGALDVDAGAAQDRGHALQHGAGAGVRERDRDAGEVRRLGLGLGLDPRALGAADLGEELAVLVQAVRRQRGQVVARGAREVRADGGLGPVGGVRLGVLDRGAQLVGLRGVRRVEGDAVAELEGVEHQHAVTRAVDLGRAQRPVHRQGAHDLGQHAGAVALADHGPLALVLAADGQVERLAAGARRDDRAQVCGHAAGGRVLEVHARHLRREPRDDRLGGGQEALAQVAGQDGGVRDGGGVDRGGGGGGGGRGVHSVGDTTRPQGVPTPAGADFPTEGWPRPGRAILFAPADLRRPPCT